jgi:mono/diheme cytochrome c family protein
MRRWALVLLPVAAIAATAAALFFFWPAPLPPALPSAAQPAGTALIAKGEYLTQAADCAACHTAPGGQPFAGGLPFNLPFGTIYSPNITPDTKTGIGGWTDAQFVRALRRGVGRHGEDLYPALPYVDYALLSTDDVLAIRAYLASLPPVHYAPPANRVAFPFNQRFVLRGWKLLFLPEHRFVADPAQTIVWNRGAYLAGALGHCGECHTPRDLLFATRSDDAFAGAVVDGWKAYDITPYPATGIGAWSGTALAAYLATGHADGHGSAAGGMAEVVSLSLRHLTPSDIAAMVTYLRALPPRPSALPGAAVTVPATLAASTAWSPPAAEPDSAGRRIFEGDCASCHGWDGSGQEVPHAALLGASSVNDPDGTNLIRVILSGAQIESTDGTLVMPSFAAAYSDAEIAAVSNYLIGHFGGESGRVTPAAVAKARAD